MPFWNKYDKNEFYTEPLEPPQLFVQHNKHSEEQPKDTSAIWNL